MHTERFIDRMNRAQMLESQSTELIQQSCHSLISLQSTHDSHRASFQQTSIQPSSIQIKLPRLEESTICKNGNSSPENAPFAFITLISVLPQLHSDPHPHSYCLQINVWSLLSKFCGKCDPALCLFLLYSSISKRKRSFLSAISFSHYQIRLLRFLGHGSPGLRDSFRTLDKGKFHLEISR